MNNNLNNRSIVLLKSCCILNYVKVKSPEYHAHLRYKNFYKDTWVRICEFLQTNKKYILGNNSKKVKKGQKRVVKSKKVRYNWKRWLKERRSTKQEKVLMRKKVKKSKKRYWLVGTNLIYYWCFATKAQMIFENWAKVNSLIS